MIRTHNARLVAASMHRLAAHRLAAAAIGIVALAIGGWAAA